LAQETMSTRWGKQLNHGGGGVGGWGGGGGGKGGSGVFGEGVVVVVSPTLMCSLDVSIGTATYTGPKRVNNVVKIETRANGASHRLLSRREKSLERKSSDKEIF